MNAGVVFEQHIHTQLENSGCVVLDTPSPNDYGADLIVHYQNKSIAIQCKFYSNPVGVNAVQEVLGAINFYGVMAAAVVTNSSFTQQAIQLARANHILLIDGPMLPSLVADQNGHIALFDMFLDGHFDSFSHYGTSDFDMNDIIARYGLSKQQIIRYCLREGMPYYRIGREYYFPLKEVAKWEIQTKYITYGRGDYLFFPAWAEYVEHLKVLLNEARREKDKLRIRLLRKKLKKADVLRPTKWIYIFVFILVFFAVFLLNYFGDYFRSFLMI